MPNLIHGQDPGGSLRPIQVDDNGNLSVDLVSGVSVSTTVDTITSITNTVGVNQVSGAVWSTTVTNDAAALLVNQVSGAVWSTTVTNDAASLAVQQVSGAVWSTTVTNDAASLLVQQVSGAVWSTTVTNDAAALLVQQVSGSMDSTEISGVARTTNPTAVADAASVKFSADDLGRLVITPYQVRDLLSTAYVATTTGIETTLLAAGGAGVFLDCVQVVCANQSDAVVDIDFRSVTAGNVEFSVTVPADSTAGFIPSVPWPQGNANNNWTMDVAGSDVSNTTVNVAALFIKNI